MRERLPDIATHLTLEQGKPLVEARIEVAAAADIFEWFAEEGRRAYWRIVPARAADVRYQVLREPVGPVAAFAPWNVQRFVERASALKVGAGLEQGVQMGPLANPRRPTALQSLVDDALARGAQRLMGGAGMGGEGHFWQPTLLAHVPDDARVMHEEPFGPLAVTATFATLDQALAQANRLPFGLAAYAFTESIKMAHTLASEVECGMLGINNMQINFAETPFGGVKHSGFGSEGGSEGLDG